MTLSLLDRAHRTMSRLTSSEDVNVLKHLIKSHERTLKKQREPTNEKWQWGYFDGRRWTAWTGKYTCELRAKAWGRKHLQYWADRGKILILKKIDS